MCGIAGIVDLEGPPVEQSTLATMAALLEHRGPDGDGFYCNPHVGLAHRRLSIIDPEGGAQPIHNEDRSIWVVFNGEIFNYPELRKQLIDQGHQFYTQSDTEVLVHLYEALGARFVDALNGQFAIALWDERRRRLVLARDRVGISPLYYRVSNGRLSFASEIKALLAAEPQLPGLNAVALDQVMTFWAPIGPETMFEGVYELPPGNLLTFEAGRLERHTYWDWEFPPEGEFRKAPVKELAEELRALLIDATQIRLRADVPVGAYLSGGLDSSTLVSLITHHGPSELQTFSIGFEASSHDETPYQESMVRHLGTRHSQVMCAGEDIAEGFEKTIWHTEAPILRSAPVPMRILSGLVRKSGYKVVLTGEGADEVFGGYDLFKEAKIRRFWAKRQDSSWRPLLLKRLYPYLDISGRQGQAYLQAFFGRDLDWNSPAFAHLPRWTTTSLCKEFFSEGLRQRLGRTAGADFERSFPGTLSRWHMFNRAQYIEAKSLLAGYLLSSQGDRMLMANGVEGRFPFLDHRVIEFAASLHPDLKMKVLDEKHLLKRAVQDYLPAGILRRHKQPYRAPDIAAFTQDGSWPRELLSEPMLTRYDLFDPRRVSRLLEKTRRGAVVGTRDNMAFVGILSTQIWYHLFIDSFKKNQREVTEGIKLDCAQGA